MTGSINAQFISDVCQTVATYYNLEVSDITGKMRTRLIAEARHISIYLVRKLNPRITWQEIGRQMNRDHSSCIWVNQRIDDLISVDKIIAQRVHEIESDLLTPCA